MLEKVLFHKGVLAPYSPTDAELSNYTDKEYNAALDAWVVSAQAAPYVGQKY